jgi:hypothetical protein
MPGAANQGQVCLVLIEAAPSRAKLCGVNPPRPLYFPVKAEPLRMQAGLARFGTDFGNGEADRLFFPRDGTSPRYLAEKARVLALHSERTLSSIEDEADERSLGAAAAWFSQALASESQHSASQLPLLELGRELVEDFAIVRRAADGDRALLVHACFPSGWRPEHVAGKSFREIHANIPGITPVIEKSRSLVEAITERGPYVRFVWTISADDELDHHPEQGRQRAWSAETPRGFLRVERQTTVPLAEVDSSVFLIVRISTASTSWLRKIVARWPTRCR